MLKKNALHRVNVHTNCCWEHLLKWLSLVFNHISREETLLFVRESPFGEPFPVHLSGLERNSTQGMWRNKSDSHLPRGDSRAGSSGGGFRSGILQRHLRVVSCCRLKAISSLAPLSTIGRERGLGWRQGVSLDFASGKWRARGRGEEHLSPKGVGLPGVCVTGSSLAPGPQISRPC